MKILVVSSMFPNRRNKTFGIFVKKQIEALRKIGIDVVKVIRTRDENFAYMLFFLKTIFYLLFNVYDLIHAHYGFHSAFLPAIIRKKPLIITFHGSDALKEPLRNKVYYYLQRFVISRSDHIIAVSNEIKDVLVSNLGANPNKISVISCGVETTRFLPLEKMDTRRTLNISKSEKVVLFIGKFRYEKGVDIIIKCAYRMPDVMFILVGRGTIRTALKNCSFVGVVSNDEIPTWMSVADVFFLPSRSEGTPVVLLEALSCALPVVASRVGGIPDLVRDGETGCLVESENLDMFIKKLQELLQNPEKRRQMSQKGRKDMIDNYDSRKIANDINQIYESVSSLNQ